MMEFWRALFAFFFLPLYIGGSSSSSSQTKYQTTDNRVAGGADGSVAVGAGGAGVGSTANSITTSGNVTITDTNGASFARLLDSLDRADALQGQALAGLMHSADGIVGLVQSQASANGSGLDNKTIALLVAVGVVGVVALVKFKG